MREKSLDIGEVKEIFIAAVPMTAAAARQLYENAAESVTMLAATPSAFPPIPAHSRNTER